MRGCASKTGTGRIVMIITIRQLNPILAASFSPFWAVPERGCPCGSRLQEVEINSYNKGCETVERQLLKK